MNTPKMWICASSNHKPTTYDQDVAIQGFLVHERNHEKMKNTTNK